MLPVLPDVSGRADGGLDIKLQGATDLEPAAFDGPRVGPDSEEAASPLKSHNGLERPGIVSGPTSMRDRVHCAGVCSITISAELCPIWAEYESEAKPRSKQKFTNRRKSNAEDVGRFRF